MKYSILIIAGLLFIPITLFAAMTGGSFELYADSFSFTDGGSATGGSYTLFSSAESFQTATSTDGTFELSGGFQAQEKGILRFALNSSSISLGTLSTSTVASGTVSFLIETDSETGFALALSEDGNLRSGANDINDVADGTVTAGSEEYGVSITGSNALFGTDQAIDGSLSIASGSGLTNVGYGDNTISFKAAVSSSTASGTYSHIVTFTATVNP